MMLAQANQQITSVGWFVGILEGEGCFDCRKSTNIQIRIANSNTQIIEFCEQFLTDNFIHFNTYKQVFKNGNKDQYTVQIKNRNDCIFNFPELLYKKIEHKLECRKDEYQRILGISEARSPLSIDIDWLIGIFEAEGSFSLTLSKTENPEIKIELANSNFRITDKVMLNLKALGCNYATTEKENEEHQKRTKHIHFNGMDKACKFLTVTKDLWYADRNKQRTNLMLDFISSRKERQGLSLNQLEYDLVQEVMDLNRKRKLEPSL